MAGGRGRWTRGGGAVKISQPIVVGGGGGNFFLAHFFGGDFF